MNSDVNNLFLLNDLSIDREKYKKVIKKIPDSRWSIDNRGTVYNSYGKVAAYDPIWDGSPRVRLNIAGSQQYRYINDLVLRTFVGPPPSDKHVPWHCDCDRSNCSLDNLSWQVVTGDMYGKATEDGWTGSDQGQAGLDDGGTEGLAVPASISS